MIVDHQDAGGFQPHPDEAGEVEHRMSGAHRRDEEHGVVGVGLDEALDEFAADFVAVLADQGADRGDDAAARRRRAFPSRRSWIPARRSARPSSPHARRRSRARLGSTNSTGPQSAVVTPSARPSVRVTRASAFGRGPPATASVGDDDVGRMDLVQAEEALRRDADLLGHAAAVFRDMRRIVVGAERRH